MSSMEPLVVTKRESGRIFAFEVKSVPVQLVNAIRRILLNETPVVELNGNTLYFECKDSTALTLCYN